MRVEIKISEDGIPQAWLKAEHLYGLIAETERKDEKIFCNTTLIDTLDKEDSPEHRIVLKLTALKRILMDILDGPCPDRFKELAMPLVDNLSIISTDADNVVDIADFRGKNNEC